MGGTIVCPLCVQWRCSSCRSNEWPNCCDKAYEVEVEPYWPNGAVATLTQHHYCDRCAQALADYEANRDGF